MSVLGRTAGISDLYSGLPVEQVDPIIYRDRASLTPFMSVMTKLNKTKMIGNMEWRWMRETLKPPAIELADAYTQGALVFKVPNGTGAWFNAKDLIWDKNAIQFRVVSIAAGATVNDPDEITVELAPDTQSDTDLDAGDPIVMGPGAFGDLESAPDGNIIDETEVENYLTNSMRGFTYGYLAELVEKYGEDWVTRNRDKIFLGFKQDKEAFAILAKKLMDDTDKATLGTFWVGDGVLEQVGTDRALDFSGGAWDWATFSAWLDNTAIEYLEGDENFGILAPPSFFTMLETDTLASGLLQQPVYDERFGFKINKLVTSAVEVPLVRCKALKYLATPTALFCDFDDIQLVGLKGFGSSPAEAKKLSNLQDPDEVQKRKEAWWGIMGVQVNSAVKHAPILDWAA